jgi:anaphase-promoting complex subunit 3
LQLDPFLFTSFQALSDMKVAVDARSVFGGDCAPPALPPAGGIGGINNNNMGNNNNNPHRDTTPMPKSTTIKVGGASSDLSFATPLQPAARRLDMSFSPFVPSPIQHSTDFSHPSSAAITRQARQVASRQYYPPSPDTPMTSVTRSMRYLKGLGENNSNRPLFTENTSTENTATTVTSIRSEAIVEKIVEKPDKQQQENDENVNGILSLLTTFGCAYQLLSQNRCKEAIDVFHQLPLAHQRTPLVLHYVGKAHLEQGDFLSAQRSLEQMHRMDPGRMEGLELLSTVYWQLKKEIDLANLAQRTMDWDYESPQANCIAGNCFSLQKDHETALVFFRRSLQLDPYFTYTHTLSGYEYMACEDFYQAVNSFRNALSTDEGHYNAWYGLGSIYHRQEKYDLAEYHFGRAVQLHPTSSVLRCNLGMAQNANNKPFLALETLAEAFRLDPRNPQARFQRATIYSAMNRPEDALAELEIVRDAAPQEATVWFAMGKILKKLNRPEQAMRCFLTAMDLDPKDSQLIKSAMDKLDEPDIDDESTNNF